MRVDPGLAEDVERRYRVIREAAERDGLDAVLVCATEYTGFEGAMFYLSGFRILHRYAYVLLPVQEPPTTVKVVEAVASPRLLSNWSRPSAV